MAVTALEVQIAASDESITLGRFTTALEDIGASLREIDRSMIPRAPRPRWVVVDLQTRGSSLNVRLTAKTQSFRRPVESLLQPVEAYVSGIRNLRQEAEVPDFYTDQTVTRLLKIGSPDNGVLGVSLALVNGQVQEPVRLDHEVLTHARQAVRGIEKSLGSVTGTLDILNHRGRGGSIRVSIFNHRSRHAVSGWAPQGLDNQLRQMWGHRVAAMGELTRNERGQVVRLEMSSIESLPESDDLRPRVDEMLGIAPGWTGQLSVDEYIAQARRG